MKSSARRYARLAPKDSHASPANEFAAERSDAVSLHWLPFGANTPDLVWFPVATPGSDGLPELLNAT
ncbi:MAG: hypothetical protein PSX37_05220 [bacterium]|nr:hypothetical protein [bacterium]